MESAYEQPNPWHRDFTAKMCGLRTQSVRDRVYAFLTSSFLNELREMGRETRTKHTGVKNTAICHLLIKAQEAVSSGDVEWDGFLCGCFHSFWSNPYNISAPVRIARTDENIRAFCAEPRKECDEQLLSQCMSLPV